MTIWGLHFYTAWTWLHLEESLLVFANKSLHQYLVIYTSNIEESHAAAWTRRVFENISSLNSQTMLVLFNYWGCQSNYSWRQTPAHQRSFVKLVKLMTYITQLRYWLLLNLFKKLIKCSFNCSNDRRVSCLWNTCVVNISIFFFLHFTLTCLW